MKTVEQWLIENLTPKEFENALKYKSENWQEMDDHPAYALGAAFSWKHSQEGDDYWRLIFIRLDESKQLNTKRIDLSYDELFNLLKESYRNGYNSYEEIDAGLERYDADGYARWVLAGLQIKP